MAHRWFGVPFRVPFDPEDLPSTPRLWRGTKCRIEGNPFRMNPYPEPANAAG